MSLKNDLNIGIGKIISKNTDSVKIVVHSVYDLNLAVVDNEQTLNFEIGSILTWNTMDVMKKSDIPTRKRKCPKKWKKYIEKDKRMRGLEYKDYNDIAHDAKMDSVVQTCPEKCARKCPTKINSDQQIKVRNTYWNITNYEAKNRYLSSYLSREEKATAVNKETSRRAYSNKYFLPDENDCKIQVCQKMYLNTLGVTDAKVCSVMSKMYSETPFEDRFRHAAVGQVPANTLSNDIRNAIKLHIDSFPTVPSHYCRKSSKKHYFEKGLNAKKMYKAYEDLNKDRKVGSVSTYRNILASYNTSFYKPMRDACTVCLPYKNTINKTVEIEKGQKGHRNNVDRSREEKEKDKRRSQTDDMFLAIIIDLEQVSPCPKGNFFLRFKALVLQFKCI